MTSINIFGVLKKISQDFLNSLVKTNQKYMLFSMFPFNYKLF